MFYFKFRFSSSLCYYGLTFNSPNMGANVYAGFALSMLVEFPAIVMCHVLAVYVGRRLPLVIALIAGGVALLLSLAFTLGKYSATTFRKTEI